ncbi:hypothetical protein [Pendulispora albinea]|uniref:Uncharacterized protein n=1 Tax=Pendulispora albinea TaxID=2741071 RepID=A0ABZ2M6S0_9BACT
MAASGAAACSDDKNGGAPPNNIDKDKEKDKNGDAGLPDSGSPPSPDASDAATPMRTKSGWIYLENAKYTVAGQEEASHFLWPVHIGIRETRRSACAITAHDDRCQVRVCSGSDDGSFEEKNAGDITLGGITLDPDLDLKVASDGTYANSGGRTGSIWSGGEHVQFQAAGNPNGAPGFDINLTAPPIVAVSAPKWSFPDARPELKRSEELHLAWTSAGSDPSHMLTYISNDAKYGDPAVSLSCEHPLQAGAGTISASLLSKIPAGKIYFRMTARSRSAVKVGDWDISATLVAQTTGENGVGSVEVYGVAE